MIPGDRCEIFAVRHGRTDANRTGVLQGQSTALKFPLDETGRLQAEAVAERLAGEHFDAVYSSDLPRAVETAEAILKRLKSPPGTPLRLAPELREWGLGELEGKTLEEAAGNHPELLKSFRNMPEDLAMPGGESLKEFRSRVTGFLDRIATENPGKRLLLVSHGGAIQCMFIHAAGKVPAGKFTPLCANASLSILRHWNGVWQLVSWNETGHLERCGLNGTQDEF